MKTVLPRPQRAFRRITILTVGATAILVGLALGGQGFAGSGWWVVFCLLLTLITYRKRGVAVLLAVAVGGASLGLWRGGTFLQRVQPYQALYDQKVVLRAVALDDAVYDNRKQLTFEVQDVTIVKPDMGELPGRIKVSGFGANMVYRGDVIEAEGKLREALGGRQAQISFADIQVISHHTTPIDAVRRNFAAGMQNALPEPASSFGTGLLTGQRSTLPEAVRDNLSAVSLTHIVAVSGYNLTIIVMATRRLTERRSKFQSTAVTVTLIAAFLLVTGFSASIVRAAIVSGLALAAWYYGRTIRPLLLIGLTAALTAYWNPLYLWGDIGWYLSFLAFFGVLVLAPLLTKRLLNGRQPKLLAQVLLETVCAQIMTLPLILFVFQQLSVVSLLSNLAVVPLVPLAMLLSLVAGIAGTVMPEIAGWVAWPAKWLLTYMLDVAALLARVPHAVVHYTISWQALTYLYATILSIVLLLWLKIRPKYDTITEKNTNSS